VIVWGLLSLSLACLAWHLKGDAAEYQRFKAMTGTADRQRTYYGWVAKSLLLMAGPVALSLALLGRFGALAALPLEFAGLAALLPTPEGNDPGGMMAGVAIGLLGGLALAVFAARRKASGSKKPRTLGEFDALVPRNRREVPGALLLSINAGFSEELFFRLLLPLLIALATGSAIAGFLVSAVLFGIAHHYQGWVGVLATGVFGLVFTLIYLVTGSIWLAVALHAAVDILSLVVRPFATGALKRG